MSTSSPFPVSDDIQQAFKDSAEGGSSVSFFQIQVKDEQFVLISSQSGTGNISNDFNKFCAGATNDQANYFLYRGDDRKDWTFVTFVPEVPVKEKMIYASAKGTLKDKLGHGNFTKELHFTTTSELTFSNIQDSQKPVDSRSDFEKVHEKVLKEEDAARTEAQTQHTVKTSGSFIGGYHTVAIPLSSSAISELDKIKSGSANWVALLINDTKTNVNADSAKTVSGSDLKREINMSEPRFYIYAKTPTTYVFIYCCPEKSPPKLRMVYSTSKPSILDQVEKRGFSISKKAEITEAQEVDEALSASVARVSLNAPAKTPVKYGAMPEQGGTTKAKNLPTVQSAHPLGQMMMKGTGGMEGSTTKKKIVIPPASAW